MSDSEKDKSNDSQRKPGSFSEDKTHTYHASEGGRKLSANHPRQIGPYVLERVIASGGMGTVFEALQENPRRPVALKVIKSNLASESASGAKRAALNSSSLGDFRCCFSPL